MRTSTPLSRQLRLSLSPFRSHPSRQYRLYSGFHHHEKRPLIASSHGQAGPVRVGQRNFHVQHYVDAYLQTSHDFVLQLQTALHTPWYVTIPLFALGINALVRLPFIVSFQKDAQKRVPLAPILKGWFVKHSRDVMADRVPAAAREKEVMRRFQKTQRRLDKEWGLRSHSIGQHLLGIPVWLVATETIRRMCGGPPGLIGLLGSARPSGEQPVASTATETTVSTTPVDIASTSGALPSDVAGSVSPLFEPSLSIGGCLWFPDLTVADPYHILPFAFSAVVVFNLLPSSWEAAMILLGIKPKGVTPVNVVGRLSIANRQRLHRAFLIFGCSLGFITMHLPSAIHLYWITSSFAYQVYAKIVKYFMPVPKPKVTACRNQKPIFLLPNITKGSTSG